MTTMTRRKRAIDVLTDLENQSGQLSPELVVEEAASPDSPLHGYFLWDDEAAGHAFRLEQARQLIRSVKVELITRKRTLNVVQYVHDERSQPKETMYVRLADVSEAGLTEATLEAEFQRIEGVVERARGIATRLDQASAFEARLRTLMR